MFNTKHLLLLIASLSAVAAFAPAASFGVTRVTTVANTNTAIYSNALEEANEFNFNGYSITNPDQRLAYTDEVMGDGDMAQSGKVLTMAYEGKLMSNGKVFDTGTGYSFRLGEGKVIPGWEQGLQGMRVGGVRILRIPPSLAYADRGAKDVIPPGAHLEFRCELKGIAANAVEETLSRVNVQPERIITFVLLLILLAVAPSFQ